MRARSTFLSEDFIYCPYCGNELDPPPSHRARGAHVVCSGDCYDLPGQPRCLTCDEMAKRGWKRNHPGERADKESGEMRVQKPEFTTVVPVTALPAAPLLVHCVECREGPWHKCKNQGCGCHPSGQLGLGLES